MVNASERIPLRAMAEMKIEAEILVTYHVVIVLRIMLALLK